MGDNSNLAFSQGEMRKKVLEHIVQNAAYKGIEIVEIGGINEHLHSLLRLPQTMSISSLAQLIKGEATYWINRNFKLPATFEWQAGYYATGVSLSDINKIKMYIQNQEIHHLKDK